MSILEKAQKLSAYMKDIREEIHRHPELGGEEWETNRLIRNELSRLGIDYTSGMARTGVVGLIEGKEEGKTILLRADMDALPMQELNNCPYKSENDGVMHACGHDAHVAMLLGAAHILHGLKNNFAGNVKLCFQPAEEAATGGAEEMVREGLLENPKVDFAAALHVEPLFSVGSCGIEPGPVMAAPDFFSITFYGKGGAGSLPYLALDPIDAAVEARSMIHALRNKVDPLEPCVIQVCMIHAGTAQSVIPEECTIQGTVRTFDRNVRKFVREGIEKVAKEVCHIYGTTCKIDYRGRCFAVVNDETCAKQIRESVKDIFELGYRRNKDMSGEDFCFISDKVPAVYIPIGSSNHDKSTQYPLHNPYFDIDSGVLEKGAAALAKIAFDFLNGNIQT